MPAVSTGLSFSLNGQPVSADGLPLHTTLLDFLRARGLTGAKEGCAEGECGSCSVVMVDDEDGHSVFRVVNSCLMFAAAAAEREFYTVEALAEHGELAPAQKAMAAAGGSQCGYCTPGFVMSLFAEHYRRDRVGPCDPHSMAGNLCRCTGYRPIADAARALGAPPEGKFTKRLEKAPPSVGPLATEAFSRPASVQECIGLLRQHRDAVLIAGTTDIGVESNLKYRRWPHLISVEAIPEMRAFSESDAVIRIGAALPMSEIGRRWKHPPDAVLEWLTLFASPPLRNRATLGGNLATASPIGDAAPLLLAMDASVEIAGGAGRRLIPLREFFTGYRKTRLEPGEILTAVEIPKPLPATLRFYKVSKRRLDDISTVAAAMALDRDSAGGVRRARFAFGGVAATPVLIDEAEQAIRGRQWNEGAMARVQEVLARSLKPMSDHRGSAEYRRDVSTSLVEKFWREPA
jgi:xanthine dehydrogenase small subunit